MKLLACVAFCVFVSISCLPASPRDSKGPAKITKNEAEHIALKHFPGGRVAAAKMETVQGKVVWLVQIVPKDARPARRVEVDAVTGRVISLGEKKR